MSTQERLFLFDGMALAYRAYYAFISRPLINSKGENTSAIYGFASSLMKILDDEKPEHIAVVFDTREPTFRHRMFTEYKATRQKMPEDMSAQMEKLKEMVRAFNIPLIEVPGYEADDIIGTLARRAESERVTTYMVTGDKDFMQLITPFIRMFRPGKTASEIEVVDEASVKEKFGVTPDRVIDVLALIGDKSDNIPGVPGVGEKTAIPLIQKYGGLEELYTRVDEIPQKGVREKLIKNKELAFLSKKLVTINTDVPVDIDFHALRAAKRNTQALIQMFGELEFKSLAQKLRDTERFEDVVQNQPEPAVAVASTSIASDQHSYRCITSDEDLEGLHRVLGSSDLLAIRTLTTSSQALRSRIVGLAVSAKEHEAYYIPVHDEGTDHPDDGTLFGSAGATRPSTASSTFPLSTVLKALRPVFEDLRTNKVGHDIKQVMLALHSNGIRLQGAVFDTMVASYILRADGQHNLPALAKEHCGYEMIPIEDLLGKGKNQKTITEVPLEDLTLHAAQSVDLTLRVYHRQLERLRQLEMLELCDQVEFPLIPVLARMESAGIMLDVPYLSAMSKDLDRQISTLVREIYSDAGEEFNINSTQQLSDVLFNKLNLPTVRKTKTGFSTDVNVLESLKGLHPVIDKLLDYRQLAKLKSTYIDALPLLINPRTGRVHTSFNQTVAATGRLSGSDPNLQNIPIRTDIGRAIRKAFKCGSPGNLLMSADYSQIELRVMAHISGDEGLVDAFRNNEDIHTSTAAKVFGVDPTAITRDMRRKAKEVNFGIMYGIGPFGLATRLEISQSEAKEIIATYFERFPKVKQYINDTIDSARRKGYVSTLLGRRRYLPDINSRNRNIRSNAERQAINMPIQGTAADMIKVAMIAIDNEIILRRLKSQMLLQVHDELVFEVPQVEIPEMKEIVTERMRTSLQLSVPVAVEMGTGSNWLEAH